MRGTARMSRVVVAVCGFALVVGLVGCSGSPQPEPIDTGKATPSSSESTPTPTETPTPTPTQTAATAPTGSLDQQLHDATVAFYETVNRAFEARDPELIRKVATPGASAISGYVDSIEQLVRKNHKLVVTPFKITNFAVVPSSSDATKSVRFDLADSGATEVDASGKTVDRLSPTHVHAEVTFVKKGDSWLISVQNLS